MSFFPDFCRGVIGDYNWTRTEFDESVPMSTYLIAVVISDYKCRSTFYISKLTNKNITIEICARPTASNQLNLAFNSSVPLLEFFETYYNVSYPLPKLGKTFKKIIRI